MIALCSLLGLLQGDLEIHQLQDCYAAVNDTVLVISLHTPVKSYVIKWL